MGNCLKTQLKEVVNNDNLLRFEELKIQVKNNTTTPVGYLTVSMVSGVQRTYDTNGVSWNPSNGSITGNNGTISVFPKSQISQILMQDLTAGMHITVEPLDFFKYTEGLTRFKAKFTTPYNFSILNGLVFLSNIVAFTTEGDNTTSGDIAVFGNSLNLTILNLAYCNSINGNISSLANAKALTTLYFNSTSIEGSLDVFAATQAPNRNNGDAVSVYCNGKMTYKSNGDGTGEEVIIPNGTRKKITFNNGSYTIS